MIASKYKELSYMKKSILINALIMLIWWLAFNPGFFSADSFGVIEMVRNGNLSSEGTVIWAIFVKYLTINGSHPELATLFFSQVLAFSISIFANTLFTGSSAVRGAAILCGTPLVGAMGITLWHDIPMTSGFLFAVVGFHRLRQKETHSYAFLLLGIFLASFRYNGLPTLLVTCFLLIVIFNQKKLVIITLLLTITIGGMTSALDAGFSPVVSTHSDGLVNWMRYDLSCYAATSNDDKFFQKEFSGKSTRQYWQSSQACVWFNDSEAFFQRPEELTQKIPSAWLALAMKDPLFVLTTHMKRNAYLNPVPLYGLPSMPFIHTTIEYSGQNISFWIPEVSEKLRQYPRIWNYFNFIFGYSGLWLLLILVLALLKRNALYFGIGILGIVLNMGLFVFAIISDARFSLFVLIGSQLVVVGEILEYIRTRKELKASPDSLITSN